MKELDPQNQDKELAILANHQTLKLIGRQAFIFGLPLWSLNTKTKVIEKAKLLGKKTTIKDTRGLEPWAPHNKLEVTYDVESNPDLIFIQALNIKNAARKFGKAGAL